MLTQPGSSARPGCRESHRSHSIRRLAVAQLLKAAQDQEFAVDRVQAVERLMEVGLPLGPDGGRAGAGGAVTMVDRPPRGDAMGGRVPLGRGANAPQSIDANEMYLVGCVYHLCNGRRAITRQMPPTTLPSAMPEMVRAQAPIPKSAWQFPSLGSGRRRLTAGLQPWAGPAADRPSRGSPTRAAAGTRSHRRPRDGCRAPGSIRGRGRARPSPARRRR